MLRILTNAHANVTNACERLMNEILHNECLPIPIIGKDGVTSSDNIRVTLTGTNQRFRFVIDSPEIAESNTLSYNHPTLCQKVVKRVGAGESQTSLLPNKQSLFPMTPFRRRM